MNTTPLPPGLIYRDGLIRNAKDNAEMLRIPAGQFTMGTNPAEIDAMWKKFGWGEDWKQYTKRESPKHDVHLDDYYIYKHPVTVKQYRAFCTDTEREMPKPPPWGWQDDHPIVRVSWYDAAAYCQWVEVALPTEAQWEKAARGTDGRIFPWGNEWDSGKCNSGGTVGGTTPVGSYPDGASPYGALDMAGNVWEWCMDKFDETFYGKNASMEPNPVSGGLIDFNKNSYTSINDGRVLRGSSHGINLSGARTAARVWYPPGDWSNTWGFRCVVSQFLPLLI